MKQDHKEYLLQDLLEGRNEIMHVKRLQNARYAVVCDADDGQPHQRFLGRMTMKLLLPLKHSRVDI